MKTQIHTACNVKLAVEQLAGVFTIMESCPAGHGKDQPVGAFLDACVACPQRTGNRTDLTVEAKADSLGGSGGGVDTQGGGAGPAAPELPPPPAQMPAPLVQYNGPLIPLPAELLAPTAPVVGLPTMPAPLPLLVQPPGPACQPTVEEMFCQAEPLPAAPAFMPGPLPTASSTPAVPGAPVMFSKTEYQAPELPALENIKLPGGMTLGAIDAGEVDLDAVLASVPGLPFSGSSAGGFSAHKLADATCWRRFYLKHILGMQQRKPKKALQLGTLFHAVMAMRYSGYPDRQFEPLERAAQAGLAELAFKVKAMCLMQFEKYQLSEVQTWSVRAVEHNMLAWIPARINKKNVAVPISCRADMIVALKRPDEPHPGGGPLPQGVLLGDWKTSSGITYDLVSGYGMDQQFLTEAAIFKLGGHEQTFGPLRGVLVSLAGTARKQPTFDDFVRLESPISHAALQRFIEQELTPLAVEAYERVTTPEVRADINCWPMDHRQCVGRWGRCEMFDYCDADAAVAYRIDQKRILTTDGLASPPVGWRTLGEAVEPAVAEPKAKKRKSTEVVDTPELELISKAILEQIEAGQLAGVSREQFCSQPGHNYKSVASGLTEAFRASYASLVEEKKTFGLGGLEWRFVKAGLTWKNAEGGKGRVGWKAVADWICRKVWFNLAFALPG